MNGHPLVLSIPRADTARGVLGLRHTAYLVQIDDCGKVYERHRRYTNFLWLHRELRQHDISTLPELPPKRAVGSLDQAFVEERRRLLEAYLQALLSLAPVVLNDALWVFLDADLATAVVPRFLCRQSSPTETLECLTQLANVVSKDSNVFRFCSAPVLGELVAFVQSEATEEAVCAAGRQQARQARLSTRLRLCSIVQSLSAHKHARQGLVDAGMFGAMLALLWRATEDSREASSSLTVSHAADTHQAARSGIERCLVSLLDGSRGAALLDFCQQDAGLRELQRLATAETTSLHSIAASLLWHGFQNNAVINALAGAKTGLPLLGKLLKSPDLGARVLASLCVGSLVRHEGSLDASTREHCLDALTPLPEQLEKAEVDAMARAAAAALAGDGSSAATSATPIRRDPALSELLQSLCAPVEVPRLQVLFGEVDGGEADAVTAVVLAVVEHFAQQSVDEPERLRGLCPLVPQLQGLVDGGTADDLGAAELRRRAARVLVHLERPDNAAWGAEVPLLGTLEQRVRVLGALAQQAETLQGRAASRLSEAGTREAQHGSRAGNAGLTEAPCLETAQLDAFGAQLARLGEQRRLFGLGLGSARRALEALSSSLDQRAVARGVLSSDVEALCSAVAAQASSEANTGEMRLAVSRCEERHHEASLQAEARFADLHVAEAAARDAAAHARDAEDHAAALAREETERAEICHNAPAQLERLHARLVAVEHQRSSLQPNMVQLSGEIDHEERRHASLSEAEQEAEAALQNLASLDVRLEAFRGTLTSELILTDDEMEHLRHLEEQLQPARPTRLLRQPPDADAVVPNGGPAAARGGREGGEGCGGEVEEREEEGEAPVWDDIPSEQAFRDALHFRAFARLCDERRRLWASERRWLQGNAGKAEASVQRLQVRRSELEQEEQALLEEAERLRRDLAFWDRPESHRLRLDEARASAAAAREAAQARSAQATEAAGCQQLAEALLEQARARVHEAEAALAVAREQADADTERSRRERLALVKRCLDLEARTRTFIEGWQGVALEEEQVTLLQRQVDMHFEHEAQVREGFRLEIKQLSRALQELDHQLDITG